MPKQHNLSGPLTDSQKRARHAGGYTIPPESHRDHWERVVDAGGSPLTEFVRHVPGLLLGTCSACGMTTGYVDGKRPSHCPWCKASFGRAGGNRGSGDLVAPAAAADADAGELNQEGTSE